jgi:hypothetical protein
MFLTIAAVRAGFFRVHVFPPDLRGSTQVISTAVDGISLHTGEDGEVLFSRTFLT